MSVTLFKRAVSGAKTLCNRTYLLSNIVESKLTSQINVSTRNFSVNTCLQDSIEPTKALENSSIPLKKKVMHKKVALEDLPQKEGQFLAIAYATANTYDLKSIKEGLLQQKLYEPGT